MKFNVKAMAITCGLIWGAAIFLTGVANLIWSGYGQEFLRGVASVYPGYHGTASFSQVIVGTLYGLVDGAGGGWIFALLYNALAGGSSAAASH